MGACVTIGRVLLVIFNIFFLLIGLIFFAGGLFLRFGESIINGFINTVKESLKTASEDNGFGTLDFSDFSITSVLQPVSIAMILFGLFILVITFLGCCGACCKIKFMLLAYVIICVVVVIGQIVVIGILFGSPNTFKDPTKTSLKSGIQSDYSGLNGTNLVSIAWNIVHQQVGCCGVDNYDDFTGASKWTTDYTSYSVSVTLKTPITCCKTLPSNEDFSCAGSAASETDNYLNTGCVDKIWDMSIGNAAIVGGVLGGVAAFQVALIIFGVIVFCSLRKNKTAPW